MTGEKCKKCDVDGEGDLLTLKMECFYDMSELGLPFEGDNKIFTLEVCKGCRDDWMQAIRRWFEEPPSDSPEYIRRQFCDNRGFISKPSSELDKYEHELAMLERLKEAYDSPIFGEFLDDSIISTSQKISMCKHLLKDKEDKKTNNE